MMKKSSWCHVIAKIAGIVLLLGTIVAIVFVLHPIKSSRHPASDGNEQRYSSTKDTSASNKDRSKGESLDAKGNASNKKGDSSKKNSKKKVSYINKEGSDLTTRIRVPEGFTRIDVKGKFNCLCGSVFVDKVCSHFPDTTRHIFNCVLTPNFGCVIYQL